MEPPKMTKHNHCGEPYLDFLPTAEDLAAYDVDTLILWRKHPLYYNVWRKVGGNRWRTCSTRGVVSYARTCEVWADLRNQFDKYNGDLGKLHIQIQ